MRPTLPMVCLVAIMTACAGSLSGAEAGIVADLAGKRRTNLDLRPYRPDRF